MTDLHWTTVQRRVKDLVPHPRNPRTITTEKMAKLKASIERFNFVEIPAIDTNGTIISGHQRLMAMQLLGRGEETVDVRLPSRPLTAKEIRDLNLTCNIPFGQNDMDMILADFEVAELTDLGFDLPDDFSPEPGEQINSVKLSEKFGVPPFSVLNAREGWWQNRKSAWIALGIKSECGRGGASGSTPPHPPTVARNADGTLNYNGAKNQAVRFNRQRPAAAPSGSARPACDYSGKQRGDGHGRPIK